MLLLCLRASHRTCDIILSVIIGGRSTFRPPSTIAINAPGRWELEDGDVFSVGVWGTDASAHVNVERRSCCTQSLKCISFIFISFPFYRFRSPDVSAKPICQGVVLSSMVGIRAQPGQMKPFLLFIYIIQPLSSVNSL